MSHTPGPWRECRGADKRGCVCGLVWSSPADAPVASCDIRVWDEGPERFLPLEERQANARLIAAAPDLLAAVEALLDGIDDYWVTLAEGQAAVGSAHAAIAKATVRP